MATATPPVIQPAETGFCPSLTAPFTDNTKNTVILIGTVISVATAFFAAQVQIYLITGLSILAAALGLIAIYKTDTQEWKDLEIKTQALEQAKTEITTLQTKLASVTATLTGQVSQLETNNKALEQSEKALRKEVSAFEKAAERLKSKVTTLKTSSQSFRSTEAALNKRIAGLTTELSAHKQTLTDLLNAQVTIGKEIGLFDDTIKHFHHENEGLAAEATKFHRLFKEKIESYLTAQKTQIAQLQASSVSDQTFITGLKETLRHQEESLRHVDQVTAHLAQKLAPLEAAEHALEAVAQDEEDRNQTVSETAQLNHARLARLSKRMKALVRLHGEKIPT